VSILQKSRVQLHEGKTLYKTKNESVNPSEIKGSVTPQNFDPTQGPAICVNPSEIKGSVTLHAETTG